MVLRLSKNKKYVYDNYEWEIASWDLLNGLMLRGYDKSGDVPLKFVNIIKFMIFAK